LSEKRIQVTDSGELAKIDAKINYYNSTYKCKGNPYQNRNTMWIGWLLTAFAITLGAPFWFDLLNKLVALRSSAKPKQEDIGLTELNSKSPGSSPINRVG
jgi:hypothetical protein